MDLAILKKKISTYKTEGGYLKGVSDELLIEILLAWELWTGPVSGFYSGLGVDHRKMASLMGKAKKLKREGHFAVDAFKEVKVAYDEAPRVGVPCGIELTWDNSKLIRFAEVSQLVDFLKAAVDIKGAA